MPSPPTAAQVCISVYLLLLVAGAATFGVFSVLALTRYGQANTVYEQSVQHLDTLQSDLSDLAMEIAMGGNGTTSANVTTELVFNATYLYRTFILDTDPVPVDALAVNASIVAVEFDLSRRFYYLCIENTGGQVYSVLDMPTAQLYITGFVPPLTTFGNAPTLGAGKLPGSVKVAFGGGATATYIDNYESQPLFNYFRMQPDEALQIGNTVELVKNINFLLTFV